MTRSLTRWERVQLARHPERPRALDLIRMIFTDFFEFHGDRYIHDDPAMVGGLAKLEEQTVMVIGNQKGSDTRTNVERNFGMSHPEGYRKAQRLMRHAEQFGFPVIFLVDTPAADPGMQSEERGQAWAIAEDIATLTELRTPVIVVITGEGGSGGALAIAVGDRVLMLENAVYSTAPPEASSSILWKDRNHAADAANAMRVTAQDLLETDLIDGIIPEPEGGAHTDHRTAAMHIKEALLREMYDICTRYGDKPWNTTRMLEDRYNRFRHMGSFTEVGEPPQS